MTIDYLRDRIHELAEEDIGGYSASIMVPEPFTALIRVLDLLDAIEDENSEYWQLAFEIRREIRDGLEGC